MSVGRRLVTVDPHVSLLAVLDLFTFEPHDFNRSLICMYYVAVIYKTVKPVINEGEVGISAFDDPVGHCVRSKVDTIGSVGSCLPVQRDSVYIFSVYDRSDKRRSRDTVAEQISRTRSFDYDAAVILCRIYMNMMFIDDKSLGDDEEPFIDFLRKLLISIGELPVQFFIRELMLNDASREPVKVFLTFAVPFSAFISLKSSNGY